jgi:ubiquitin C-terminal hydrolase
MLSTSLLFLSHLSSFEYTGKLQRPFSECIATFFAIISATLQCHSGRSGGRQRH